MKRTIGIIFLDAVLKSVGTLITLAISVANMTAVAILRGVEPASVIIVSFRTDERFVFPVVQLISPYLLSFFIVHSALGTLLIAQG